MLKKIFLILIVLYSGEINCASMGAGGAPKPRPETNPKVMGSNIGDEGAGGYDEGGQSETSDRSSDAESDPAESHIIAFKNNTQRNIKISYRTEENFIRQVLAPEATITINEKITKINFEDFNNPSIANKIFFKPDAEENNTYILTFFEGSGKFIYQKNYIELLNSTEKPINIEYSNKNITIDPEETEIIYDENITKLSYQTLNSGKNKINLNPKSNVSFINFSQKTSTSPTKTGMNILTELRPEIQYDLAAMETININRIEKAIVPENFAETITNLFPALKNRANIIVATTATTKRFYDMAANALNWLRGTDQPEAIIEEQTDEAVDEEDAIDPRDLLAIERSFDIHFPGLEYIKLRLGSSERFSRYLLSLVTMPTKAELDASYDQLKQTWDSENPKLLDAFGQNREFLTKINKLLEFAYAAAEKIISDYEADENTLKQINQELEQESEEDTAIFKNETDQPVYLGNYVVQSNTNNAELRSDIDTINPGETKVITLFTTRGFRDKKMISGLRRRVIASHDKRNLTKDIAGHNYAKLANADIGSIPFQHARKFYITGQHKLEVLTKWEKGKKDLLKTQSEYPQLLAALEENYPNKDQAEARVVRDPSYLSREERNYIQQRQKLIKDADLIGSFIGQKLEPEDLPTIGLAFTGGGYRAMVETLGYLKAADRIGLLNISSYMTGLSGSTWALNPWVASGMNIEDWSNQTRTLISDPTNIIMDNNATISYLLNSELKSKFPERSGGGRTDLVGYFGASLANALIEVPSSFKIFDTDKLNREFRNYFKQLVTLSELSQNLKPQIHPLPISTAVGYHTYEIPITWYEFSPFTTGTHEHGGLWIDTKFLGRKFDNGISLTSAPEEPLSYLMGIWGSAMCINYGEVYERYPKLMDYAAKPLEWATWATNAITPSMLRSKISGLLPSMPHQNSRLLSGHVPNLGYNMQGIPGSQKTKLKLFDGGHDNLPDIEHTGKLQHNFASIPLLRPERNVDVLIMCDSDRKTRPINKHLESSKIRARELGLPFPRLEEADHFRIYNETVSLLADPIDAPVMVYMACKQNDAYKANFDPSTEAFTITENFSYTPTQFNLLNGLAEFIMLNSQDKIKQAIQIAVQKKRISHLQEPEQNLFISAIKDNTLTQTPQNILDIRDLRGHNLLHIAVHSENVPMIQKILSDLRLTPEIKMQLLGQKNNQGQSPIDLAREKSEELMALLKEEPEELDTPETKVEDTDTGESAISDTEIPKTELSLEESRNMLFDMSMSLSNLQTSSQKQGQEKPQT